GSIVAHVSACRMAEPDRHVNDRPPPPYHSPAWNLLYMLTAIFIFPINNKQF
ncbi:hypothetical protein L9F63_025690, partial [Diploptera punctata]